MKKNILLLFSGGTIAMAPDPLTGALKPALNPEQLYSMAPKIKDYANIKVEFITDVDSSNMTSREWIKIIQTISSEMNNYDAFVITHGTDTMAETASAISFAFGSTLSKPVIITGSQSPPNNLGTDAIVNLERAILAAISTKQNIVMLSFHDFIFRGTRAKKQSERKLAAFHSPAEYPLGEHMGDSIYWSPIVKTTISNQYLPFFNERVIELSLHSATEATHMLESLLMRKEGGKNTWTSLDITRGRKCT